jgi:hypothetical protein
VEISESREDRSRIKHRENWMKKFPLSKTQERQRNHSSPTFSEFHPSTVQYFDIHLMFPNNLNQEKHILHSNVFVKSIRDLKQANLNIFVHFENIFPGKIRMSGLIMIKVSEGKLMIMIPSIDLHT